MILDLDTIAWRSSVALEQAYDLDRALDSMRVHVFAAVDDALKVAPNYLALETPLRELVTSAEAALAYVKNRHRVVATRIDFLEGEALRLNAMVNAS